MRMPVRTPHATSSPNIGDISHLGAEIEPIPEVAIFVPAKLRGFRRRSGNGPLLRTIIDPLASGARLLACPKHLKGCCREKYRFLKSLAEPAATFVIINNYEEINRWRPPPYPKYSRRQRLQS